MTCRMPVSRPPTNVAVSVDLRPSAAGCGLRPLGAGSGVARAELMEGRSLPCWGGENDGPWPSSGLLRKRAGWCARRAFSSG